MALEIKSSSLPRQMYQRSGLYLFRRKTAVRLCHALDVLVLFCKDPKEGLRFGRRRDPPGETAAGRWGGGGLKKKEKDDEIAACHSVL